MPPFAAGESMYEDSLAQTLGRLLVFLRQFLLELAIGFVVGTAVFYWFAPDILSLLQAHLGQRLAFFGVMEPVVALLKLSVMGAAVLMTPWMLWRVSQGLRMLFGLSKIFCIGFVLSAMVLFYGGAAFCFFFTLPFGIQFLLGYQSAHLRPVIAVDRFVDFVGFFLLGFGVIFELPLVMTLLCRLRLCKPQTFGAYRRYAILIVAIVAAVLTPTPDIFNMSLMGVPLYLLYEVGILVSKWVVPRPS